MTMYLDSVGNGHVQSSTGDPLFEVMYRLRMHRKERLAHEVAIRMPFAPQYAVGAGPMSLTLPDGLQIRFEVPLDAEVDEAGFVKVVVISLAHGRVP